jgi:hypothetical protein
MRWLFGKLNAVNSHGTTDMKHESLIIADPTTADCAAVRFVSEAAFEQLSSPFAAGLGAELGEWLDHSRSAHLVGGCA